MDELDQRLREIVRRLARMNPLTPTVINSSEDVSALSHWSHKHVLSTLLKVAKDFRARDQLGKLRAALLVGTTVLGEKFLTRAERSGILLASGRSDAKFAQLLNQLNAETAGVSSPDWTLLNDRLRSYSVYQQLVAAISSRNRDVLRSLRIRPRRIVKVALGFTALAFLHEYLDVEIPSAFSNLIKELDGPEQISNAAS